MSCPVLGRPVLGRPVGGDQEPLEQDSKRQVKPDVKSQHIECTDSKQDMLRLAVRKQTSPYLVDYFEGHSSKNPTSLDSRQKLDYTVKSVCSDDFVSTPAETASLAEQGSVKEQRQAAFPQPRLPTKLGSLKVHVGSYLQAGRQLSKVLQLLAPDVNKSKSEKYLSIIMIQPCIPNLIEASVSCLNELKDAENARLIIQPHPKKSKVKSVILLLDGKETDCLRTYDERRVFTCNKEYGAKYLDIEKTTADPEDMTAEQMVYNALNEAGQIKVFKKAERHIESTEFGGVVGCIIGGATGLAVRGFYIGLPLGLIVGGAVGAAIGLQFSTYLPAYKFEMKD